MKQLKVGSEIIWLWIAIESETKNILAISLSKQRNIFPAEHFLSDIVDINMTSILFQQMVVHGIYKHANF